MSMKIGIMQGRLSPPINNLIQAFPIQKWRDEFSLAKLIGVSCIEWIYEKEVGFVNPISTDKGIAEILLIARESTVMVESLCADYFISEPLLRGPKDEQNKRLDVLFWLIGRCQACSIKRIILPFVDNSKIRDRVEFDNLIILLKNVTKLSENKKIEIHLETSLEPEKIANLLELVSCRSLKINYDSGNSASLGYDVESEFLAYGKFIGSIHIKDRVAGGNSVPLGKGSVDFSRLAKCLRRIGYRGDYILQVARGSPGDELSWAKKNISFIQKWLPSNI